MTIYPFAITFRPSTRTRVMHWTRFYPTIDLARQDVTALLTQTYPLADLVTIVPHLGFYPQQAV